jgi:hypothetical protein
MLTESSESAALLQIVPRSGIQREALVTEAARNDPIVSASPAVQGGVSDCIWLLFVCILETP